MLVLGFITQQTQVMNIIDQNLGQKNPIGRLLHNPSDCCWTHVSLSHCRHIRMNVGCSWLDYMRQQAWLVLLWLHCIYTVESTGNAHEHVVCTVQPANSNTQWDNGRAWYCMSTTNTPMHTHTNLKTCRYLRGVRRVFQRGVTYARLRRNLPYIQ